MGFNRIQFQEMLDNLNLFQTFEEQTFVDRFRHWITGRAEGDDENAHINFALELKYRKNGKSHIYKQRYDITHINKNDQEIFQIMEMRFFTWVVETLIKQALKFN